VRDAIDEELAVEVVDLVLEADGLEAFGANRDLVALEIARAQQHALGALDLGLEIGDGEAALLPEDLALGLGEHGVHEDQRAPLGAFLGPLRVDHDQAHGLADLGRREADARLVVHHLAHVASQLAQRVRDLADGLRELAESRIRELEDGSQGQGRLA
jgi:predicted O-linked N-acetylglucosamine transferase (SPINDLY family)